MKQQILRLLVLVLFAAIGGFAAHAQDTPEFFVNFTVDESASYCDENGHGIAFTMEYNMPDDAIIDWTWTTGLHTYQGVTPVSGYQFEYSAVTTYDGPLPPLPYWRSDYQAWYSPSGQMISIQFEILLECSIDHQVRLVMVQY